MIYKLFSQRQREAEGGKIELYRYEDVSYKLRNQIIQIMQDALGYYYVPTAYDMHVPKNNNEGWDYINKLLCREMGVSALTIAENNARQISELVRGGSTEQFLDILDVVCSYISRVLCGYPDYELHKRAIEQKPLDAISEINYRLLQDGFGYQYESGTLIRVDSLYAHQEIVKPMLGLLTSPHFAGSQDEFLEAHRLYRGGDFPQAIVAAGKAFESALKSACDLRSLTYNRGDRSSELLKLLRSNDFFPFYVDKSFDQLLATLSSALPQLRNNEGAHGQGAEVVEVPRLLVEYALNLSASKILLISQLALGD